MEIYGPKLDTKYLIQMEELIKNTGGDAKSNEWDKLPELNDEDTLLFKECMNGYKRLLIQGIKYLRDTQNIDELCKPFKCPYCEVNIPHEHTINNGPGVYVSSIIGPWNGVKNPIGKPLFSK